MIKTKIPKLKKKEKKKQVNQTNTAHMSPTLTQHSCGQGRTGLLIAMWLMEVVGKKHFNFHILARKKINFFSENKMFSIQLCESKMIKRTESVPWLPAVWSQSRRFTTT